MSGYNDQVFSEVLQCQNNSLYQVATVQLNLNFTHTCRYMRVLARLTHAKLQKNWCVHAVFLAILACAHGIANTHDTREMHVKQACTWFATLHVWCKYRYSSSR